jgi:hypothetical protein
MNSSNNMSNRPRRSQGSVEDEKKLRTVVFDRAHKHSTLVVKLIIRVRADTREEAVEKALAQIKEHLPHDELFHNDAWESDDDCIEVRRAGRHLVYTLYDSMNKTEK